MKAPANRKALLWEQVTVQSYFLCRSCPSSKYDFPSRRLPPPKWPFHLVLGSATEYTMEGRGFRMKTWPYTKQTKSRKFPTQRFFYEERS